MRRNLQPSAKNAIFILLFIIASQARDREANSEAEREKVGEEHLPDGNGKFKETQPRYVYKRFGT